MPSAFSWFSTTWFSSGYQLPCPVVFLCFFNLFSIFHRVLQSYTGNLHWKPKPKAYNQGGVFFYEHLDCDDGTMEPFTYQH